MYRLGNPRSLFFLGSNGGWLPVFAVLLCCNCPSVFAQGAGGVPRINNYAIDNCLHWGTSCGKPAADAYCQRIGQGVASSYQMGRMRPTLILGDNRMCDADNCVGFTQVRCSASGGTPLPAGPQINGYAIDNCLHWGTSCGKPAADAYCQRIGQGAASSYQMGRIHPTLVLGDNRVCNQELCVGFTGIQCGGGGGGGGAPMQYYLDAKAAPYSVTTAPLQSGMRYVVELSGTWSYWGNSVKDIADGGVDAVWCYPPRCRSELSKWQSLRINGKGLEDFSGQQLPYNPQHVYRIEVVGGGAPVKFEINEPHEGMGGGINIRISPR